MSFRKPICAHWLRWDGIVQHRSPEFSLQSLLVSLCCQVGFDFLLPVTFDMFGERHEAILNEEEADAV